MKGRVILVEARALCGLPPIISLINVLKALDYDVVYLGLNYSKEDCAVLDGLGIEYQIHPWYRITKKQFFRRILKEIEMRMPEYAKRRWLWRQIRHYTHTDQTGNTFVWSFEMLAAAYLGNKALELGKRHIQTFYELGDENCGPIKDLDIGLLYSHATLVECEENRARILMEEKGLQRMPFVIPNKIFEHPRKRRMPIKDPGIKRIVDGWGKWPVFLYQGWLGPDRMDLFFMLEWLAEGLPNAIVAIMTRQTDMVRCIAERHQNVSVIPFIPPPEHLAVTSWATVGLAAYTGGSVYGLHPMNAVHCAPNKIFEYAGFGIPILCNAIQGLKDSVGRAQSGLCVEQWYGKQTVDAARRLLDGYDFYSKKAVEYFDSVNLTKIVTDVLKDAKGR